MEMLMEVAPHFGYPLGHKSFRGDDQRALEQSTELEFPQDEPGLNGFAKADLVRQEITHPVAGNGTGQCPDLVWQRDNGRLDRCEQDVLRHRVGHPCSGCDVGNVIRRAGASTFQGLEPGSRDADHGVTAGQPDTAGRLAP
jgi:hypothetical protein